MGRTVRPSRLLAGLAAALVIIGGGAVAANADQLAVDGDGIAPITNGQALTFEVCAGETIVKNVLIAARRNGNNSNGDNGNKVFQNGSTVTVGLKSAPVRVGVALAGTTIKLSTSWADPVQGGDRFSTDTIKAAVTLSTPSAPGSGSIAFTFAGTDIEGKPYSGENTLPVSWTMKTQGCDSAPPALNLPGNLTVEATSAAGATVPFVATATDTSPANPPVTCTPGTGSVFGFGVTTVNCQATDAAGNTANGSFTVTVRDTTAPAVGQPSNISLEATGATTTATWTAPTATDAVDGTLSTSCTPPSGSSFEVGTSNVVCAVTDAHGNTGSATFTVTISDKTAPALFLPSEVVAEATSAAGAAISYAVSAADLVDGPLTPSCSIPSGSTFALGDTTVSCTATDAAGNVSSGSFPVKVRDTTPPELTLPAATSAEATGPTGAVVTFSTLANDIVDAKVDVSCTPASGSIFGLGETTVTCDARDDAGNTTTKGFVVTVKDTTGPAITAPTGTLAEEATGPAGAVVTYTATATDLVDGAVDVTCVPASGSTFPLGMTAVVCDAEDSRGNQAGQATFPVLVQDTTDPVLDLPDATIVAEATGPSGAVVAYAATATDVVDEDVDVTCDPAAGSTFPLGKTTVQCVAEDASGNAAEGFFDVLVEDTTAPAVTWVGGPADGGKYPFGSVPAAPSCTAVDAVDPAATCVVTGYGDAVSGTAYTLTAKATDHEGNVRTETRSYTVEAWKTGGFYAPVDGNGVWNTVKGGSTVPLKFELFAGSTELTSTSAISSFKSVAISCSTSNAMTDEIEFTTTGGTSLRYDATAGQFIQNWQTPKTAGACYKVTMTAKDGSAVSALFKLK